MPDTKPHVIDCEEALRHLAAYLDRELDADVDAELERHLEACRSCYSRAEFERRLKGRLEKLRHEPVDAAFEQRICDLARGFGAR